MAGWVISRDRHLDAHHRCALARLSLAGKSYRSFAGLRKIGPKMAEIKARYADDKPRFQQELIKLYEAEKVNPMAGCFLFCCRCRFSLRL